MNESKSRVVNSFHNRTKRLLARINGKEATMRNIKVSFVNQDDMKGIPKVTEEENIFGISYTEVITRLKYLKETARDFATFEGIDDLINDIQGFEGITEE